MGQQEEEGPSGFQLDLRPRYNAAIAFKISPELKQAMAEAQQAGRPCSLRFETDSSSGKVRSTGQHFSSLSRCVRQPFGPPGALLRERAS